MKGNSQFDDYESVTRSQKSGTSPEVADGHWIQEQTRISNARLTDFSISEKAPAETRNSTSSNGKNSTDRLDEKLSTASTQFRLKTHGHSASFAGLFLFTVILCFRPYELSPYLFWTSYSAFWTAIVTIFIFALSQLGLKGNLTARPREVNLVLLLCLTAFLSIPGAYNPKESWDAFVDFLKVALIFIVMVNVVRSEFRLRALLWIALAVSCMLSIHALGDYLAGNFAAHGERVVGVIGGMFANPNDMALHLVTIIPIAIALTLGTRGLHMKALYGICAVFMVVGCAVTFSRGGMIGLVTVAGVLAWKLGRKQHLLVGFVIILAVGAFVVLAPSQIMGRFGSIATDASAIQRRDILIRSLIVALRHPLFGIGMDNFHIVSIHELVSHNAYTQVASELGLTALVCYVLFMIAPFRHLRRIERETYGSRENARLHYLAIGLQASLIGYMVNSFFASVAYLWYVYYLVGYAVCLRYIYESKAQPTQAARDGNAPLTSHSIAFPPVLPSQLDQGSLGPAAR
jgi:probable O-glycosylation ligase (exosortase A-associated)